MEGLDPETVRGQVPWREGLAKEGLHPETVCDGFGDSRGLKAHELTILGPRPHLPAQLPHPSHTHLEGLACYSHELLADAHANEALR